MIEIWDDETSRNPSAAPRLREVVRARLSRRTVLAVGVAAAASGLGAGILGAPAWSDGAPDQPGQPGDDAEGLLGFAPVPLSTEDSVIVPDGYSATPFVPWGTPILGDHPQFRPGANTAAEQEQQVGMHHDAMHYFPLAAGREGNRRGLLVLNHEYTDEGYLHTTTATPPPAEAYTAAMVALSQAAHGISVVEIERGDDGSWAVVRSKRNRRITANTPMEFAGPAAGHSLVRTAADPEGERPVGTINNCANGVTPWDTYLTCEENFHSYFGVAEDAAFDLATGASISRYGVGGDRFQWATHDDRFQVSQDETNEPNRFGWVVEIDPFRPHSTPVKRTALGRMKHEGAFVHVARGGRIVVYMGDDQVDEYVYKFVSESSWRSMRMRGLSPLDEGILYVARFSDDGTGTWLPLVHGEGPLTAENGFADQGEVVVKARLAADAVGATPMDRPEWTAVDPATGLVYLTLTNHKEPTKQQSEANPRIPNPWGHILRWAEADGDHTGTSFSWELFVLAGEGRTSGDGSTVEPAAAFGSPDGLWIDPHGRVWIQTDGDQPEEAHNQMLVADPTTTHYGTPELRRFLTGPVGCEVTGITGTPDGRTMFVNIQHPGEESESTWPGLDGLRVPRSATVVITKDDAGVIGT